MTLRGKVLEIGGVKEKVLAAYRAGLREVIAARRRTRRTCATSRTRCATQVRFTFVQTMDEAIERMLLPAPPLGFADDLPLFDGGTSPREGDGPPMPPRADRR